MLWPVRQPVRSAHPFGDWCAVRDLNLEHTMANTSALIPVSFRSNNLTIIDNNGVPLVAMRPIGWHGNGVAAAAR